QPLPVGRGPALQLHGQPGLAEASAQAAMARATAGLSGASASKASRTVLHPSSFSTARLRRQLLTPGVETVGRPVRAWTRSAFNSPSVRRTNSAAAGVPRGTCTGEPGPGPP